MSLFATPVSFASSRRIPLPPSLVQQVITETGAADATEAFKAAITYYAAVANERKSALPQTADAQDIAWFRNGGQVFYADAAGTEHVLQLTEAQASEAYTLATSTKYWSLSGVQLPPTLVEALDTLTTQTRAATIKHLLVRALMEYRVAANLHQQGRQVYFKRRNAGKPCRMPVFI